MAISNVESDTVLLIRRTVSAPRSRVFAAWTNAEQLKQWHAPGEATVAEAEVDVREGGRYRIIMKSPDKDTADSVVGTYETIVLNERLVYTWQWEPDPSNTGETRVTVEFLDAGAETEIVIIHERFPNAEMRDKHNRGWCGCLDNLGKYVHGS